MNFLNGTSAFLRASCCLHMSQDLEWFLKPLALIDLPQSLMTGVRIDDEGDDGEMLLRFFFFG